MTKALLVQVDGSLVEKDFEGLEDLQSMVGGHIEMIWLGNSGQIAYINEEGKLRNLPLNNRATQIAIDMGTQFRLGDYIVGNMVIVGGCDADGYETDVSESLVNILKDGKRVGEYANF